MWILEADKMTKQVSANSELYDTANGGGDIVVFSFGTNIAV